MWGIEWKRSDNGEETNIKHNCKFTDISLNLEVFEGDCGYKLILNNNKLRENTRSNSKEKKNRNLEEDEMKVSSELLQAWGKLERPYTGYCFTDPLIYFFSYSDE